MALTSEERKALEAKVAERAARRAAAGQIDPAAAAAKEAQDAATDPQVRAAVKKLQKSAATITELLDGTTAKVNEAVNEYIDKNTPLGDVLKTRRDHFFSAGTAAVTTSLETIKGNQSEPVLQVALYRLNSWGTAPADMAPLTMDVLRNMEATYSEGKQDVANWQATYASLKKPADIELNDADALIRSHLRKVAATTALKALGIKISEQASGKAR